MYEYIAVIVTIIVIIFFIILIYLSRRRFFNLVNKLPSPNYSLPRLFFIFAKDWIKTWDTRVTLFNVPHAIAKRFEKEGLFSITVWPLAKAFIVITSPRAYQDVMSDSDNIDKNISYTLTYRLMGKRNLINSGGEEWRHDRPIVNPAFTGAKLASLNSLISEKVDLLIGLIKKSDNKINDMHSVLTSAFTHVMIEASTGTKIDANGKRLLNYVKTQKSYIDSFVIQGAFPIFLIIPPLFYYTIGLPLTLRLRRMKQFIRASVDARIDKIRNAQDLETPCLSDTLINAHLIDAKIVSKDAIMNHVITFIVTSTTATPPTLNAILFLLASHPDKQKKLQEELDANFNRDKLDAEISNFDIINKCTYLDAAVKEGLRIYPISASIGRKITEESQIADYTVPVGSEIIFDFTSLMRHPESFPYQPNAFIPERFIPGGEGWDDNRHPYAFIPFASGLRTCVGNMLSVNMIKIFLIKLLIKYDLCTTKTADELRFAQDVVVYIKTPIDIQFIERS